MMRHRPRAVPQFHKKFQIPNQTKFLPLLLLLPAFRPFRSQSHHCHSRTSSSSNPTTSLLHLANQPHTRAPNARNLTMSTIPQTQRSAQIAAYGGPEVIKIVHDAPVPTPGPNQVLVKNTYIGINFIDTYVRSGLYPASSLPHVLGREGEGTISAVGSAVRTFHPGDRVAYLGPDADQEYTAVDTLRVVHLPPTIPPSIAAASILQGMTALSFLRESYSVQPGDYILVHAAAGGLGLWFVQLARALGATVLATASSGEKLAVAKEFGADYLVNYSVGDWVAEVKSIMKGVGRDGVAAVFDGVGKDTFDGDLEVVGRKGTVVCCGNSSGVVPPLTIARLAPKSVKLLRPQLFSYIATREEFESYSNDILNWIVEGKVKPKIHKVYPLEEVTRAHEDITSRATSGKLLLRI